MVADRQEVTRDVETSVDQVGNTTVERQKVSEGVTAPTSVMAARIIWYIVGFIVTFIVLRIVLLMLAANEGNAFVDLIYGVGGFFAAPFFGLFNYQPTYGQFTFEVSSVVAIAIYALVGWGLTKLFALGSARSDV